MKHPSVKQLSNVVAIAGFLLVWVFPNTAPAQNLPVVHWINDSGQDAASVLNSNAVFVTSFKTTNDVKVTPLTTNSVTWKPTSPDVFGGASPGNNPWYLTQFVGVTNNGTGDGVAGDLAELIMSLDATGSLQFDFQFPLTPYERILLIDVDGTEQYLLQAYVFNGTSYAQVSLTNWTAQGFSGQMGVLPDSRWPVWNPAAGTVTSGSSDNLNEPLFVLTPNRNIDRLVITKESGTGSGTEIQFLALPVPLTIQQIGTNVALSWPLISNLTLYAAGNLTTTNNWTRAPGVPVASGDSWVLTNAASAQQKFYRLAPPGPTGWVLVNGNGPSGGGIAAYDSDRQVAVMFACVGSYPNDTWEFDGATWRQVAVPGSLPHGRDASGKMVYDSFNKKMIMQGGWWSDDNDSWTWEYRVTGPGPNDRQWVNIVSTDCAYRGANCMAYDSKRHMILDFGGNHWQSFYNDTWRFDGSKNTWTWLQNWGPSRFAAGLVYDSAREKFVMFGGTGRWWSGDTEQGRGNTCEFDPKTDTWTEILPQGAPGVPGPRWFPAMVYDAAAGVTVLKGGGRVSDSYSYTDTWEWNGTTWTQILNLPGQPTSGVMWFDTARQKLVLFSAPNTYVFYR